MLLKNALVLANLKHMIFLLYIIIALVYNNAS